MVCLKDIDYVLSTNLKKAWNHMSTYNISMERAFKVRTFANAYIQYLIIAVASIRDKIWQPSGAQKTRHSGC